MQWKIASICFLLGIEKVGEIEEFLNNSPEEFIFRLEIFFFWLKSILNLS